MCAPAGSVAAIPRWSRGGERVGPVGRTDGVVGASHDEYRARHGGQRVVEAVVPRRVHAAGHRHQTCPRVGVHQQRDLPGPLVRGGAQPAADERGPGRGTGVGGRPDEDEGGDPFRRAQGGLGDNLAARRVPD